MEDARAYEELRVGFTAAVSHELRTPLARLLALLESASLPDADRDALLAQATEQVEEMSELVDDVLFLSELESGREVVALGSTPALPVLEEVRDRLANSAENADVTIRIDAHRRRRAAAPPPNAADRRGEPRRELDPLCGPGLHVDAVGARRCARSRRRRPGSGGGRAAAALRAFLPQRPGPRLAGHGPRACDRQARGHRRRWRGGGDRRPGSRPQIVCSVPAAFPN